jgi:hypothetical protein
MLGDCDPDVRDTPSGFLATTPAWFPYRIGTTGATREDAEANFRVALLAWRELGKKRGR